MQEKYENWLLSSESALACYLYLVFARKFVFSLYSSLKILQKQLFTSGPLNTGEYLLALHLGKYIEDITWSRRDTKFLFEC